MKAALLSSAFFVALSAVAQANVSYDGHKVVRVASTEAARDLIKRHALSTWSEDNGNIDVVVPPGSIALNHLLPRVLHKDLGRSIAEESQFEAYQGLNRRTMVSKQQANGLFSRQRE